MFRSNLLAIAVLAVAACLGVSTASAAPPGDASDVAPVDLIRLTGAIEPINARFIQRGIDAASHDGAQALIIQMDTPGGYDSSMRKITGAMLDAPVPIIVYVAPSGSRAGSA